MSNGYNDNELGFYSYGVYGFEEIKDLDKPSQSTGLIALKYGYEGFVMITNFKENLEYINARQNGVIGITGMDINGDLIANNLSELFRDSLTDEEFEKSAKYFGDDGLFL